jgi:hypothetical protein
VIVRLKNHVLSGRECYNYFGSFLITKKIDWGNFCLYPNERQYYIYNQKRNIGWGEGENASAIQGIKKAERVKKSEGV